MTRVVLITGGATGIGAASAREAARFAKEVAREGIRVVSVRPGYTETDSTAARLADPAFRSALSATIPIGRPGRAEEVARPSVWLLSEAASFITGTCVDVSGGGFNIGGS